jgi:hypothetical protein
MTRWKPGRLGARPGAGRPGSSRREEPAPPGGGDDAAMRGVHTWIAGTALASVSALGLVACGQDKPAVCGQADELKASVERLKDTDVSENGVGAIRSSLSQVKVEFEQLQKDAGTQFQPQIAAVEQSVAQVQSSSATARENPSAQSLAVVGADLTGLGVSVRDLGAAIKATC